MRNVFAIVFTVLIAIGNALAPTEAQGRTIIRDAEIESIIRGYATPLFQAAGLNPRAVDIYLIQDRTLNAYVSGGQNIFIHTGLLIRAEDPLQVIGVLAHEIGHITGGHIAGRMNEYEKAQMTALASYLLGIGAALLSGRPEAAAAVISGGQDLALKGLLSYTRGQEQAADQAAIRYLNGTQQSPRGLLEFMNILGDQEVLLASSRQDPYLRTHPLTQDRVIFLEESLAKSRYKDALPSPELVAGHARVRAKLIGFLESPARVFRKYPPSDNSIPARYARAIAYFKRPNLKKALPLMDELIAEMPNDPFFHELKGQMLFENGRVAEALPEYQTAVSLMPDTPQLRLALAQVMIELNTRQYDEAALDHLERVLIAEPRNAFAWRLSAIAHGRLGDKGMTSLALAEGALSRGRAREARQQAARALHFLPENSPSWLQAQDVAVMAERQEARQRKR